MTPNHFFMPRPKPISYSCSHCDEVFSAWYLRRNHQKFNCYQKLKKEPMENVLETLMLFKEVTPESLKGLLKGKKFTLEQFQEHCIWELQKEKNWYVTDKYKYYCSY